MPSLVENEGCDLTKDIKLNRLANLTFSTLQQLDFSKIDDGVVQQMHYHLNIINSLTHLPTSSSGNIVLVGSNKEVVKKQVIQPQVRFLSTKKKATSRKVTYKRATKREAASISNMLVNQPDMFISNSYFNDHKYL